MGPTSVLSAIRHEERSHSSIDVKSGKDEGERLANHLLIPGVDWKDHYGLNEILVQGTDMRETDFIDR
jgi:hypothetical protein